ncbi:methylglutaconyl-CoA hydratase, mitochondrial-like [Convolutriloba macropyga]|uniref:methylglutaconyl-CoA hydratase, mitochondrial-like n=1 Tax=Convolutriloba macropyga TaxID=536237 RepID=UPI003F51BF8C
MLKCRCLVQFGIQRKFSSSTADNLIALELLHGSKTAVLTLQRPQAKNAINRKMLDLFHEYLEGLAHEKLLSSLIVRSSVEGVFCAGADLKERAKMAPSEVGPFVSKIRSLIMKLYHFPCPTIAAINGVALGGGLELALSCDLRLASRDSQMGLVETKLGIIPGGGGTQTLSRAVGVTKAKELIFTGRKLSGAEAKELNLVNYLVDSSAELEEKALSLAEEIGSQGPVALRMAKQAINSGSEVPIETGMAIEQSCYAQVIPTKDRLEGLRAFAEKRKPVFTGE